MRIRISLFCILCLLLGACSNEEMIPSTSEGGEECAFQFLLRVPGTIDVETKAGTEPKILELGGMSRSEIRIGTIIVSVLFFS